MELDTKLDEDVILRCRSCHMAYILQQREIEWFLAKQLKLPTHCPACREKRRGMAHDCSTCYHSKDSLCACREPEDMMPGCPDWRAK